MEAKIIGMTPLYCDEKESIWMLPGYMDMLTARFLFGMIRRKASEREELIWTMWPASTWEHPR